jgi:hypothetical protein
LLGDHVIRPLCLEALIIVAHERFERNLRRLLGSFAIELKKEARNSQEINAARFVKFRARLVNYLEVFPAFSMFQELSKYDNINKCG